MADPESEVQALVIDHLRNDANITAIVEDRSFDEVPKSQDADQAYVTWDTEDSFEDTADCVDGIDMSFQLSAWSAYQGGYKKVKALAAAVRTSLKALDGADLPTHALVELRWVSRRLLRDPNGKHRRAIMTFQALLEEN